jgi:hypothetical protein
MQEEFKVVGSREGIVSLLKEMLLEYCWKFVTTRDGAG